MITPGFNHVCDCVGDQDAARKLLGAGKYAYILLDLEIPVKPGKLSRLQNGINLLTQIRDTPGMETVPVIVMTAHGNNTPDIAVAVFKRGAVDYVKKPFTKDKLDRAIQEAIAKTDAAAGQRAKVKPQAMTPFNDEPRVMVIDEDSVTICGIEVWRAGYQPDMRKILIRLSQKEGGGYVRVNGGKLMRELGRDASNPVGRPIKTFCDNARERLAEARCLECGRYDIIASKGGYHFTEWMDVRLADEPATPKPEPPLSKTPAKAPIGPRLNDRQTWIMEQIDNGIQLRQKDVIAHFRRDKTPSTIKRDLKQLRDGKLIETHPDGYYVLAS
ncbi:MAG: response regulator [Planctomycetes bacterium]|nr:response regulator [Planctomycetota bacterium]